jgi:hypothetical protein
MKNLADTRAKNFFKNDAPNALLMTDPMLPTALFQLQAIYLQVA